MNVIQNLPEWFYQQYTILCDGLSVFENPLGERILGITTEKYIGQIGRNASMIAFVNENGQYYCCPCLKRAMGMLLTYGYRYGDVPVQLHFGHYISDQNVQKKFQQLKKISQQEFNACNYTRVLTI